ncbi:hypothetical protein PAHAL_7G177300 [Panicum hallii]|uniref:PDZ domain-containing protein n=1 Tax=Panicum hallii TaxID=206008 RepID=A0A2T8ICJ6_9POAL|nr:hypothetical protein PAHAL_7G177300 [Panicum hallii]
MQKYTTPCGLECERPLSLHPQPRNSASSPLPINCSCSSCATHGHTPPLETQASLGCGACPAPRPPPRRPRAPLPGVSAAGGLSSRAPPRQPTVARKRLRGHRGKHVILMKCQAKPYCLCQRGSLSPCQPFVLAYIRQALALGEPSVKIEDVTPKISPSGPLFPTEKRIAELFETNTYSVVNIFDATLRPQLNITGVVEIPEGNGSGVVWDDSGHIVTNYHVVGSALSKNPKLGEVVARVTILAAEGIQKSFEGKLVGADRAKDLAVLKVDAPTDLLKPINVGQSSALRVGQQCLAIGNPFGFDHTLTVGVISGLNRDIFSQAGVTIGGGIQTDAAINPGNSGGPLLDSKGHMIGINTAIFTQTGTSAGVGFAIPSSTVLKIAPQLIQFGKVPASSAAAKAGLAPTGRGFAGNIVLGDVIIAVDGKPVKGKSDLLRVLDDYGVGDQVTLTVRRGAETLEVILPLEEANV